MSDSGANPLQVQNRPDQATQDAVVDAVAHRVLALIKDELKRTGKPLRGRKSQESTRRKRS